MIISDAQIKSLLQTYARQDARYSARKAKDEREKKAMVNDNSLVSDTARAFQMAKNLIKEMPDIREERLKGIQNQVMTGTYEISDDEIAEKMIGRSLVDKLV
ncbi:flagellar biosynthesis anti-sigma factor FlgM [Thermincola potens]|uniref:Anti-sigma-28 factor FlgM family protein n=1 Tax=Thermincola potens (strain JR) TaxID=635013 RepID=D5XCV6_THEPJ|nr:flagellar biosynthesis anti-sigma factor FlgM [Thermincola potens]ADG83632.1 Anti-sigma-28 factor FlgM family protein [Thermincola potens JR]